VKVLWVCPVLLRPISNGSQIRTNGILSHLSKLAEVHYVGLQQAWQTQNGHEEYCSEFYSFPCDPPPRKSPKFVWEALTNLATTMPLTVARYRSAQALAKVNELIDRHRYDSIVVDFLLSAPNMPRLEEAVLFQHNVEARIRGRLADQAPGGLAGWYLRQEAARLAAYEKEVCRRVKHVIAVSETDADFMAKEYGARTPSIAPTGVNVEFFSPAGKNGSAGQPPSRELLFVGSLDYLPNIQGLLWFTSTVLPIIWKARPSTTLDIVGKKPVPEVLKLAEGEPRIRVFGNVPDVRPYFWESKLSIVPLFAGSGTRLKIYEGMAAGVPVVSTRIGAEGLMYTDGETILIGDEADTFASQCLSLLDDPVRRQRLSQAAQAMVAEHFDWSGVARGFLEILARHRR
jgi:glycosyltransferase involved in cell wall biosynthesis